MANNGNKILRTITGTAASSWDTLVGGPELHLSTQWLRSVEVERPEKPIYVVRQGRDREIEGSAVGYLVEDDRAEDSLNRLTRVDYLLNEVIAGGLTAESQTAGHTHSTLRRLLPNLSCGGWTLMNSTIAVSGELEHRPRREAAVGLVGGLKAAAAEIGAQSVSFPYVEERNQELRDVLVEQGFVEYPAGAHYALNVTWASFEDYLAHFSGRQRYKIKRDLRLLAEGGVTYRVVALDPELARTLAPLGAGTVKRYQGFASEDWIYQRLFLFAKLGGQVILAEHEGVIRGFGVIIEWRDYLYARMVGFDYDFRGSLPIYFGVMYEQIRYAIERGLRTIEYATTSEREKMSRGAHKIQQCGYVYILDGARDVSELIRESLPSSPAELESKV